MGDGQNVTPVGTGVIVGSVVGGVLAICIVLAIILYVRYSRKAKEIEKDGFKKMKAVYRYSFVCLFIFEFLSNGFLLVSKQHVMMKLI